MSDFFLRVFQHLLPQARAWQIVLAGQLREFFEGLSSLPQDARDFIDRVRLELNPQDTTNIPAWDEQFGLSPFTVLTTQERRDRIDAAWKRTGGQGPDYLQQVMQDNGFDVFSHPFWDPSLLPARVVRNPNTYLSGGSTTYVVECGEPLAECGEPTAIMGDFTTPLGYALVNKIATSTVILFGCGDPEMECDEPEAVCGEILRIEAGQIIYSIPADPNSWPLFLYWGAETFPDLAEVPINRRGEFEDLLLSICPGQQWLGILVSYT